ncbi:MAG TPA: YceI family protein [Salinimicrobium sp.]|nr:YceI family protein [Salinimicrobium sp.]
MKKRILNIFVIAAFAVASTGCKNEAKNEVEPTEAKEAATDSQASIVFEIDTTQSEIRWKGTKPTGEHIGTIDIQSGTLAANDSGLVSGTVIIDMNSIAVLDEDISEEDRSNLENHLKGTVEGKETDFFNVEKFPTATFEITGMTEKDGQKYLQGNLTIKEETKNIEFPVSTEIGEEEITLESETFTIDRTDWKVNYGSNSVFDNLGDNYINDDMELTIEVVAKKA